MPINQKSVGGAVATFITSSMTPSVPGIGQTFTVNDATGYPVNGPFTVKVDRGQTNEEKILVSSVSGTTWTVGARGYDATVGQTHTASSSTCELALPATIVQAAIDHVDDVEADPHSTKLLNNTRHDVEARHQFGSGLAFGVPVTPTALTPDIAGAAGTGNNPAREDHVHNVPAAAASSISGTNSEGSSGSFARADHNHDATGTNWFPGAALDDLSVVSGKLAADAVIAGKIADGGLSSTAEIADAIITMAKFASEESGSYLPVWSNVTLGSAANYGRYWKLGRLVLVLAGFQLGGLGDVTGKIECSLPFTPVDRAEPNFNIPITGGFTAATARDDSASVRFSGIGTIRNDTLTATDWVTAGTGVGWNGTVPFNWGNQDSLEILAVYESTT